MSDERNIPRGVPVPAEVSEALAEGDSAPVELSAESLERLSTDRRAGPRREDEDEAELSPDSLARAAGDRRTGPRRNADLRSRGIPWEPMGPDPHSGSTIYRSRAPGGWLVAFPPTASGRGPAFYVPDPDGEW